MYDEELLSMDVDIGRILDKLRQLKLMDNTMIIFTSDHGEEFWEHGGFEHGHTLHRELLEVPLIIKWPGVLPAGRIVNDQVRTIDVMPTIMELLDIKYSGDLAGQSLLPLVKGEGPGDRVAFSENLYYYEEQKAVTTGKYKLIYTPGSGNTKLYDVEIDPEEKKDIAAERPVETSQLREQLLDWVKDCQTKASALHKGKEPVLIKDAILMRRLRSLGYL
jgi:arylsulfatase A-like enzyme